jgi:hypothetical protein
MKTLENDYNYINVQLPEGAIMSFAKGSQTAECTTQLSTQHIGDGYESNAGGEANFEEQTTNNS